MLPEAGIFHFPWEISSGALGDGTAVRTFGRLVSYRAEDSLAVLSSQHASAQYEVLIHTAFVEPFHPQVGTQYVALGELESKEGIGVVVRARVLNCVEGINLALLQRAVTEQRRYFEERECETAAQPPPL
ncbi:CST complex subunit TEN1 isoform X2 [Scleropages formosus]|uniref:CST complex subunit TEN1 isoform X2 n=1 Tax=Scleropages formosus TaxID=113540 RepID=UPI00087898B6|nr:CST complex subunit TEN1 isoform X2 [Scleropages formosus]